MKWTRDKLSIEMLDEPHYSFASTDNMRSYDAELLLVQRESVTSRHGVISSVDNARRASIVVGAGGGSTGVHERSAVLVEDLCFVGVGPVVVCFAVPTLDVYWYRDADPATCFGVHLCPEERAILVHGELEVSKWSFDGNRLWSFDGADIFTGGLSIVGGTVAIEDYAGREYRVDLGTGRF